MHQELVGMALSKGERAEQYWDVITLSWDLVESGSGMSFGLSQLARIGFVRHWFREWGSNCSSPFGCDVGFWLRCSDGLTQARSGKDRAKAWCICQGSWVCKEVAQRERKG